MSHNRPFLSEGNRVSVLSPVSPFLGGSLRYCLVLRRPMGDGERVRLFEPRKRDTVRSCGCTVGEPFPRCGGITVGLSPLPPSRPQRRLRTLLAPRPVTSLETLRGYFSFPRSLRSTPVDLGPTSRVRSHFVRGFQGRDRGSGTGGGVPF